MAALVVVMVLFFVVSLTAAYTNRNLIFEQRTSANAYRATQSFEAAQAGVEWALAMLNQGRINDNCVAVFDGVSPSFRERYLTTDPVTGRITPALRPGPGGLEVPRAAACVFNGANWNCSCPTNAAPALAAPAGTGAQPAFLVRFAVPGGSVTPGTVRIESVACPSLDLGCLAPENNDGASGRSRISVVAALHSSIKSPPAAPLTARGNLIVDPGAAMTAHNDDRASGGHAVHFGDAVSGGIFANGVAGTPLINAYRGDPMLANLAAAPPLLATGADRMFANMFGLAPGEYQTQPAIVQVGGCPCTAAAVRAAIANNPLRPIWVAGDLALDSAGAIGSAAAPVTIIVTGNITASAAVDVFGLMYSRAATWTISGSPTFFGAAVAETNFAGTGAATFVYDAALLNTLRVTSGSFVVVPGSWKDFPDFP